jgi:aspartyl-tRNA(Asn)/glutamyl-tRNA(Gln) amidotransferase subunit B
MRSKEGASDYRYFPEPDLVDLTVDDSRVDRVRSAMPELPGASAARLVSEHGLPEYDADVLTAEPATLRFFELALASLRGSLGSTAEGTGGASLAKAASNWIMGPLGGYLNQRGTTLERVADGAFESLSGRFAEVVAARLRGDVSEPAARRLLEAAMESGVPVGDLIASLGLERMGDEEELASVVDDVIGSHPAEVDRYAAGETKLLRFFVGQVMKQTEGRADPEIVGRLLEERLSSGGAD